MTGVAGVQELQNVQIPLSLSFGDPSVVPRAHRPAGTPIPGLVGRPPELLQLLISFCLIALHVCGAAV
jgi:hypothetical protein